MKTFLCMALSLACLLTVSVSVSFGQAIQGGLLGAITDARGAAVSGVTVTVTETRTNISNTVRTNESGNYVFTNLPDGVYRIEASLKGFKQVVRDGVEVKVNTTVRVDLNLPVGEVTDVITVEGSSAAPLLQTDRADTGRLLEARQIADLPLGFNRNFQGLLITVPGSTRPTRQQSEFFNPQDSLEAKVNGQSRLSNNFQIEGVDDNHRSGLLQVLIPAADAIESVSISTSNFDAEFGRAGGAVSNVTLKSGTNQFHGSAFFFGNNDNTLATNFFSHTKAPTHYRQYGFTVGGPVIKNRLFFFGDYQRTIDHLGKVNRLVIPVSDWRNGDLRTSTTKIYDPATGNPDGTGRQQISCNGVLNVICADRISPIARKLLAFLPAPNIAGASLGSPNYQINTVREKTIHSFDTKLNYQFNADNSFGGRFSFQRPQIFDPAAFGVYGGPANRGFAGTGTQNTYSTAADWTHTFNPSLILVLRFGLSRYHNIAVAQGSGLKTSEDVGIRNANTDDFSSGLTQISIRGFTAPTLGFSASLPWDRGETTINLNGLVTKLWGNHTLKMGGEWRRNRDFLLQLSDNGGVRGRFNFSGSQTGLPGSNVNNGLANAFASFLLDLPSGIGRDIKVIDTPGTRHWAVFSFIQDKWLVARRLTLDLGLRHEYYHPLVGIVDRGGLSNYSPSDNTVRVAGYGDVGQSVGVSATWKNFAPRLGAAYRINERTVVRGGFGTTIIPFPNDSYAFNFPVKQNNQFNPVNSFVAAGSMAAGFPAPIFFDIPANGIIDANSSVLKNSGLFYVPPDLREGKLHSWNAALQRELWWGFAVEAAYVGNIGRGIIVPVDLNTSIDPNAARPENNGGVLNDNAGRPFFKSFGRTASIMSWIGTNTYYNSLQVKLDRRLNKGLLLTTSYTLGQAINYTDDNDSLPTPARLDLNKGRPSFDSTHIFAQSFVWNLPFGGKGSRPLRAVLGGWQVSGILSAQSGTPISFTMSAADLHAPDNLQRPNASGTPKVYGYIGPRAVGDTNPEHLYFDPSVFSSPAPYTFGNLKRNDSINGPGYVNLDASIFKLFKFTERVGGELRVDAFNVTNTPHFNNPVSSFGSATFGQVNSSFGERLVRFGARVTF